MTQDLKRKDGYREQIKGAEAVLLVINNQGPRGEDGLLLSPYNGWQKRLEGDLAKFKKWLEANKV